MFDPQEAPPIEDSDARQERHSYGPAVSAAWAYWADLHGLDSTDLL